MLSESLYRLFLRQDLRSDGPLYWKLCFVEYMGVPVGILALAMSGMISAMCEIKNDVETSSETTESADSASTPAEGGQWRIRVSPETEHNLRLMLAILNLENHILLITAVLWSPLLVLPWLMVQTVVVLVELLLLLRQLPSQDFNSCLVQFLAAGSAIYNFLQVFCFLFKKLSYC